MSLAAGSGKVSAWSKVSSNAGVSVAVVNPIPLITPAAQQLKRLHLDLALELAQGSRRAAAKLLDLEEDELRNGVKNCS